MKTYEIEVRHPEMDGMTNGYHYEIEGYTFSEALEKNINNILNQCRMMYYSIHGFEDCTLFVSTDRTYHDATKNFYVFESSKIVPSYWNLIEAE